MTDAEKQAKKELDKLRKAATKLEVEFTEETTAEELAALVEEAKAKADAEKQAGKTEFSVFRGEELIRTYSVEVHGEEAEALAHEFVATNGYGEVR
jgi:hypothetical protein